MLILILYLYIYMYMLLLINMYITYDQGVNTRNQGALLNLGKAGLESRLK